MIQCDSIMSTGLIVTSTADISLYASNFMSASYDITSVLPSAALGYEYIAQTYNAFEDCEVGFMATEDSTELTITMPDSTVMHYTLMAAQTLQICATTNQYEFGLSGLHAISNEKPFAMFQGNKCTFVPAGYSACDHLYEQCLPTARWGKHFLLIPTALRDGEGERVRVTSLHENCTVEFGGQHCTLQAGGTIEYSLPPGDAKMLVASKEVTVFIYLSGISYGGDPGDPAMVMVPPIEQGVSSATFRAINTSLTTAHYVNIVSPTRYVPFIKIDTTSIDTAFTTMPNGYSYAQLEVTPGTHTLRADTGRFTAYFYGLGYAESYAYVAGMGLRHTDFTLFINGIDDLISSTGISACQDDSVDFDFHSSDTDIFPGWYINGTFITNNRRHLRYAFDSPGRYQVAAVVYSYCDTLVSYITILPKYKDILYDTLCEGVEYSWRGQSIYGDGYYCDTLKSQFHCDSIIGLQLKRSSFAHPKITVDNNCKDLSYHLYAHLDDTSMMGAVRWLSQPHDNTTDTCNGHQEILVAPTKHTQYSLTLDIDCSDTSKVSLSPIKQPHAAIKVKPSALDYDQTEITAVDISTDGTDRQWSLDGMEMGSDPVLRTYIDPSGDSSKLQLVSFNNYCTDTASTVIYKNHTTMWASDVFAPSIDGNDRFKIVGHNIVPHELYIYNRNGLLIFHTDNPDEGWDGTRDGIPMPQGAYVWKLIYHKAALPSRLHSATGTVTLLR